MLSQLSLFTPELPGYVHQTSASTHPAMSCVIEEVIDEPQDSVKFDVQLGAVLSSYKGDVDQLLQVLIHAVGSVGSPMSSGLRLACWAVSPSITCAL